VAVGITDVQGRTRPVGAAPLHHVALDGDAARAQRGGGAGEILATNRQAVVPLGPGVDDELRSDLQSLLLFIVTTAEQVARAVLTNSPFVRCFPCLSAQVGMLEKDVREVAQLLIVHDEFFVDRRVCQVCGHADEMLVSGKAP
jgi:hypothetical protein